jgi:type IV fimbrial biogenesis protein FimT
MVGGQHGQSILELMMVVAISGLLVALAAPNFLTLQSRQQTRSAIEEIASELRLARQLAIAHRERVRVVFDLEQRVMSTQSANDATVNRLYRYGDKGLIIDEPSAGLEIFFHSSGRTATATTIPLRSGDGQTRKLTVGITGRVSIR